MIEGSDSLNVLFLLDVEDFTSFNYQAITATCTYDDLCVKVLEGPNKGKSVLWWLARIAQNETIQPFETVWDKFKDQITINDLRVKAEEGPDKGISVLWLLLAAAANGHTQVFQAIWEKFQNQITLEDLQAKAQDGVAKGISILSLLAAVTAGPHGHLQTFQAIWEKFQNQIPLEDLRSRVEIGAYKNKSGLWWLAMVAGNKKPQEAIQLLWTRLQSQITLEDLRANVQEGPFKGISVLWWLTVAAANDNLQVFQAVWAKFQNHISLDDLRVKAIDGPHKGKSILWWVAMIAVKGNPQALQAVWKKFQNQITLEDLRAKAEDGIAKGISALWLLVNCTFEKQHLIALDILREILAQMPFALNDQELAEKPEGKTQPHLSINELIEQSKDPSRKEPIQNLIQSRNVLFNAIKTQQEKVLLEEQDINALSTLANKAMTAGYVNAFYDIGLLFYQKENPQAACTAFQELPSHAKQFTAANLQAANILLGQALNKENSDQERHEHLEAALWFTLRLNDVEEKIPLLQKIAYCHVTKGGTDLGTINFIDPWVLKCLNNKSLPKHCFSLFEIQYKLAKLEAAQQQSPAKQEEQSEPIKLSIARYTPHFNSESQALPQDVVNTWQASLVKKDSRKRCRE